MVLCGLRNGAGCEGLDTADPRVMNEAVTEACSRDGRSYYWTAERKGERKASQEVAQEVCRTSW